MTNDYQVITNDDDENENLDEVIGNLYAIADKRYEVVLKNGFRIDDTNYYLQIISKIGYLEQVKDRSKRSSKTKKRKSLKILNS